MPDIVWSSNASADFEDIVGWILDNPSVAHAESFIDSIEAEIRQLKEEPKSRRVIPELDGQNITKYREIVVPPWRVFYSVEAERILILAVIDGRRNIEDILLRRNLR